MNDYTVLVIDPPWSYGSNTGRTRTAEHHYETLGIEAAAQPSQAPVVQAVQPEYCTACDMTSNDKQRCEDCPRRASSGATTQAVRMLTDADCREYLNGSWLTKDQDDAIAAFCAVNAGRTIPADGVIGGAT